MEYDMRLNRFDMALVNQYVQFLDENFNCFYCLEDKNSKFD